MQLNDITELLRQAYMEQKWDSVIECINLLSDYEELQNDSTLDLEEYGDDLDSTGRFLT